MSDEALSVLLHLVREMRFIMRGEEPDYAKFRYLQGLLDGKLTTFSHVAKNDLRVYPIRNQLAEFRSRTTRWGIRMARALWNRVKLFLLILWFGEEKGRETHCLGTFIGTGTFPLK